MLCYKTWQKNQFSRQHFAQAHAKHRLTKRFRKPSEINSKIKRFPSKIISIKANRCDDLELTKVQETAMQINQYVVTFSNVYF